MIQFVNKTVQAEEPSDTVSHRIKNIIRHKIQIREQAALQASKDISDSIVYARRIQEAVMPEANALDACFSSSFVFQSPKDKVSGDFFWFAPQYDQCTIAVADCTGHGVPGAFMSMLGIVLLNFIIHDRGITDPSEVLTQLHKSLRKTLRQYEESAELPDGMDISVCKIDLKKNIVRFSGANHSLFVCDGISITEIKGDKFGIGGLVRGVERIFCSAEIQLKKGDRIYLSSDGFKDQFGGIKNKKFSKRKFVELLGAISLLPLPDQEKILKNTFVEWKGNLPQTDDVLVLAAQL